MAKGTNNFSRKEFQRLLNYLTAQQLSGKCIFYEMHGHINTFSIDVRADRGHYETSLYSTEFDLPPYEHNFQDYMRNRNWKEFIDEIIEDIEHAYSERDLKIKEAEERREANRKKYYEELKTEFEPSH